MAASLEASACDSEGLRRHGVTALYSPGVALVETRYAVPGWGVGELWCDREILVAHDFRFAVSRAADPMAGPPEGAQVPPTGTLASNRTHVVNAFAPSSTQTGSPTADRLIERFSAFLAGAAVDFGDVSLELDWATPFQRELADTLRAVPRGEVVSYGELAALAGRPGAARAAGAFCAANRFAFVLPCHRVVAAHGIGGYGDAGPAVKRRLLALEGVAL
jgi:methylated-DNA-[protein]-cysteine S-methyltransferase